MNLPHIKGFIEVMVHDSSGVSMRQEVLNVSHIERVFETPPIRETHVVTATGTLLTILEDMESFCGRLCQSLEGE